MNTSDNRKSLRIGLTGGIASGKTTVANLFAELGIEIVDTDVIARQVVEPGQPALAEIREAFGSGVIGPSGELDRAAMRSVIFADERRRHELEAILHPKIRAEAMRRSAAAPPPYHIIVVPLLAESPMKEAMDRIVVVDCNEDVQLERLLARDRENEEQARRIIASQASRSDRLAIADDVITNDGDLDATRAQVDELHRAYLSLSNDSRD